MLTAQMQPQANSFQNRSRHVNPTAIQRKKPNRTGLPDHLKTGIENLSGYNMDNVRIHYNSSKPAQLQALAYTQGTDIHVAPGQEKHLPHEAWHVVQQMQGRVRPTMHLGNTAVNDDPALEHEADAMGDMAMHGASSAAPIQRRYIRLTPCVQRKKNSLECTATITYADGSTTEGEGKNKPKDANRVIGTFDRYNLHNLAALQQAPGGNRPGICAEPHAVAAALRQKAPPQKVTSISVTPAKFTDTCKNRMANRLADGLLLNGSDENFARHILGEDHVFAPEDAETIRHTDATYPPCATCARWIGDDGNVKRDFLV